MRTIRRWARLALAIVSVEAAAACDTNKLLNVDDPEILTPETLTDPGALSTLYNATISDFQNAYGGSSSGNTEGFVTVSAVFTDEMTQSDTYVSRINADQRTQQPPLMGNVGDQAFANLQTTRQTAALAAKTIAALSDKGANDPRIATIKALEGMVLVALAEGFCGYVPLSERVKGVDEFGEPLSTSALLDQALARLNVAAAADGANNLVKLVRARALLDKSDISGAAAAVAAVPTTYVWQIEHSANSSQQYNAVYTLGYNGRYTVADGEGGNGMPFRSALDPRVLWKNSGAKGFDKQTPLYYDLRYSGQDAPVALASGVEARLIEAEAALQGGQIDTWLAKLNDLRAQVATLMPVLVPDWATQIGNTPITARTLAPLTDPGTPGARIDLMFRERAFWLYTTGHRLGDLRRLLRAPYNRAAASVFPSGPFFKGGSYGTDVALQIPFNENQNTKFQPEKCLVNQP